MKFAKLGDTLIEVTLAVGIFSMVAVAVVAVVSGSTSSAQTALETTVTREEIDTQAEALRFIQSSYIAGGLANAAGNRLYVKLWNEIVTRYANEVKDFDTGGNNFLEYMPSTCAELYDTTKDNNIFKQKAFIINTHKMYLLSAASRGGRTDEELVAEIVAPAREGGVFQAAATYPRIIYNNDYADDDSVYGQSVGQDIEYVEGLYVVAVKDTKGTSIVSGATPTVKETAAYYDFYIRTCWFGPGAERPSTISTVIRLYDPEVISY